MAIKAVPTHQLLRTAVERLDGFVNLLSGQGDPLLDKGASWDVQAVQRIPIDKLKAAYQGSYYARRVVDLLAEDAVVRGWRVVDPKDPRASEDARWKQIDRDFGVPQHIVQALKYARALGTGYIVPITYDLTPLDKPLSLDKLYAVQDIMVFDPTECKPQQFWGQDAPGTQIGKPKSYKINAGGLQGFKGRWGQAFSGVVEIHPSRVIPVVGHKLSTFDQVRQSEGLGDSILLPIWLALARADAIDGAGAILAQEIKQDVIRVPDLKAIGVSDAREAFETRLRLLKLSKSLLNMVVLGAGEEFESRSMAVTGYKDLAQNARDALVAGSGYPEAILFGKSASGLAVAPGTEQEAYHRKVEGAQIEDVLPAAVRLYKLFAAAKMGAFAGKRKYRDFQIVFNPLVRESDKDRDARSLILAQRDSIHAGMANSADPELGAAFVRYLIQSRYSESGWQDRLPPFNPADWPAPETVTPSGGPGGGTPSPDGQRPSEKLNQGGVAQTGAAGVDVQANNTGKGRFDSQAMLTEWVLIDGDAYGGEIYNVPEEVRQQARRTLFWKQKHPEISSLLDEAEWRQIRALSERTSVGEETVRAMAENERCREDYVAALQRARRTSAPWKEPCILRWLGLGGSAGVRWASGASLGLGET